MQVPTVTASEAAQLLQEQPEQYVLVDVRNREEQQVGAAVKRCSASEKWIMLCRWFRPWRCC